MSVEEQVSWSIGLGRWGGVPVRLHMSFFIFVTAIFYFGWFTSANEITSLGQFSSLIGVIVLFGSVVFHELVHIIVAKHYNLSLKSVMLLPWGGDSDIELPTRPRRQLAYHLSGPLANLGLCFLCSILLFQEISTSEDLMGLLNPIRPVGLLSPDFGSCFLKIGLWVNWMLFLINLLPVYPFDGKGLVRAGIQLTLRDPAPHHTFLGGLLVAQACVLALFLSAWLLSGYNPNELVPTWLVLCVLGIVVFFSSKRQAAIDAMELKGIEESTFQRSQYLVEDSFAFGSDGFSEVDTYSDWLMQHKSDRDNDSGSYSEEDEDELVDEILVKLHENGIDSLTMSEQDLLHRVSARYRRKAR